MESVGRYALGALSLSHLQSLVSNMGLKSSFLSSQYKPVYQKHLSGIHLECSVLAFGVSATCYLELFKHVKVLFSSCAVHPLCAIGYYSVWHNILARACRRQQTAGC